MVRQLKFIPKISRYANLYFFIQNLSEWHVSTRKKYNEVWRKELAFSNEANKCLEKFKIIHKKYPFGDNYLGRPFFINDNPWSEIESIMGENITKEIKEIFLVMEPYFDEIYKKEELLLKSWFAFIESSESMENSVFLNEILANFYGSKLYDDQCTVYLLMSTEGKNGGTAGTINNNSVALELSRIPLKLKQHVINVLWHELIHLYFTNMMFCPLLEKYSDGNQEIIDKMDELVASALLPNGLLKQHILTDVNNIDSNNKFNSKINSDLIIKIQQLIYPYLKQKQAIDSKLVQKLISVLS